MNSLTEQERIGLDEVFLSISSHTKLNFLGRIKCNVQSSLFKIWAPLHKKTLFSLKNRVKMPKIGHFEYKSHKKKKFLS